MRGLLGLAFAALGGCAPMLEMREGQQASDLQSLAREFCEARAAGDAARIAAVFEPKLAEAILSASTNHNMPALSSRAGGSCEAGKVWYIGGSRRAMEVRYSGVSDRLDLWLSGEGRAHDLIYAAGGKTLRERLGLKR